MDTIPHSTHQRILVVTLADLGDALLVIPALRSLREAEPDAHIDVLTTPIAAKVLERARNHSGNSLFDGLVVFEKHRFDYPRQLLRPASLLYLMRLWRQLRRQRYDACLLFHHLTSWFGTFKYGALTIASGASQRYGLDNGRGFFLTHRVPDQGFGTHHQAEYWQQIIALRGAQAGLRSPPFSLSANDAHEAHNLLGSYIASDAPLVAVHPGSGAYAPARRWQSQRWAALSDALIKDGAQVVLLGGPEEGDLRRSMLGAMQHADKVLDLGGRTTLGQLAAVLQHCDLFVGNDSGVAHLAGSVGTPVVTVFGPTDPRAWGAYVGQPWQATQIWPNGVELFQSGPHRALKAAIACSPCIYRGTGLGTPNGCPDRTCLLRIDVQQVLDLVRERLLDRRETRSRV